MLAPVWTRSYSGLSGVELTVRLFMAGLAMRHTSWW